MKVKTGRTVQQHFVESSMLVMCIYTTIGTFWWAEASTIYTQYPACNLLSSLHYSINWQMHAQLDDLLRCGVSPPALRMCVTTRAWRLRRDWSPYACTFLLLTLELLYKPLSFSTLITGSLRYKAERGQALRLSPRNACQPRVAIKTTPTFRRSGGFPGPCLPCMYNVM